MGGRIFCIQNGGGSLKNATCPVFAGDSIGRNQWESLLCMLSSVISEKGSIYEVNGNPITKHKGFLVFKFKDYNCSVEYYRAPFLVLQSRPPANVSSKVKTTLKLDQMDWTSRKWKDSDLLVLNTGHWWNYEKTERGGCYFQEGSKVKMDMKVESAFRRSLETVMEWIHHEVDAAKTQVFFRTYAPVHFSQIRRTSVVQIFVIIQNAKCFIGVLMDWLLLKVEFHLQIQTQKYIMSF